MNIKKFSSFSIAISLLLSLAIFDLGYAQREITSSIEEIVVTAQKREECCLSSLESSVNGLKGSLRQDSVTI